MLYDFLDPEHNNYVHYNTSGFQPLVLSGDALSYSYTREFSEYYNLITSVLATADVKYSSSSSFTHYKIVPDLDDEKKLVSLLHEASKTMSASACPLLILAGASDWNVRTLSKHKTELQADNMIIPYIDFVLLDEITQKDNFYARCAKLGVPFPKTVIVPMSKDYKLDYDIDAYDDISMKTIKDAVAGLPFKYPVVVKPSNSADWHYADVPDKHKVYFLNNADELQSLLASIRKSSYSHAMLIQETLSMHDDALRTITTFSDEAGNVQIGVLGHVAVQDRSATGIGNPLAIYGTGHDEDNLLVMASKLVKDMKYEGYANFDVMYDAEGNPHFLEVNARPGRNTYYVSLAGCPFTLPIVQHYVKHQDLAISIPDTMLKADDEFLFTMIPRHVAAQELNGMLREKVLAMYSSERWQNPLINENDCFKQRFWAMVNFEHMKLKFKKQA